MAIFASVMVELRKLPRFWVEVLIADDAHEELGFLHLWGGLPLLNGLGGLHCVVDTESSVWI